MTYALRTLWALALVAALAPGVLAQGLIAPNAAAELAPPATGSEVTYPYQALPASTPDTDECWDNGLAFNSPGTHPGGGDESVLQGPPSPLMENIFGYGAQAPPIDNMMADDFYVGLTPDDCDSFKGGVLYAYQTGAAAPTITSVTVQVYHDAGGLPGDPAQDPDCGGTFAATTELTDVYRVTAVGQADDQRRLQAVAFAFGGDGCQFFLVKEAYWIGYQFTGNKAFSGPWAPPRPEDLGAQACRGPNGAGAAQSIAGGPWATVVNGICNVDLPFHLFGRRRCALSFVGDVTATLNANETSVSFAGRVANAGPDAREVKLRVTYDGPGNVSGFLDYGPATLPPTDGFDFKIDERIPRAAPPGQYTLIFELIDDATGRICWTDVASFVLTQLTGGGDTEWVATAPFAFEASASTAMTPSVAPNPFTGRTQIRYTVEEATDVSLVVYDVLGREMAVLVDGQQEAGTHQATFDARGRAAGTYVWRLVVGGAVQTGRMTLAR
jgi:hypothetical protein